MKIMAFLNTSKFNTWGNIKMFKQLKEKSNKGNVFCYKIYKQNSPSLCFIR